MLGHKDQGMMKTGKRGGYVECNDRAAYVGTCVVSWVSSNFQTFRPSMDIKTSDECC